jgi:hypothetical protein
MQHTITWNCEHHAIKIILCKSFQNLDGTMCQQITLGMKDFFPNKICLACQLALPALRLMKKSRMLVLKFSLTFTMT